MTTEVDLADGVFRHIVDHSAVPFVLIERDGTIRFASQSVARVIGWAPDDLVGRNVIDFVDDEFVAPIIDGLGEIQSPAHVAAGIPAVFLIQHQDGGQAWVEVAARPIFDQPGQGLIALRLRSWTAEHHLGEFMERLLAHHPLDEVLVALTRSVASSMNAVRAAVHHGWDGTRFVGVTGSWPGAASLPLTGSPWTDALTADAVLVGPGDGLAVSRWSVRIPGASVPPAVLTIWTNAGGPPLFGHRKALETSIRYVELALTRTAEHQRLQHLAGHDSLTGVANRRAFRDRLASALAIGEPGLAVAFCDLDGFKQVNDTFGHGAGDAVLVGVADRLRATLRAGDELARMGGDEFTILWRRIASPREAQVVGDRLVTAIEAAFDVPGGQATLGISVGIALARPGMTADELLQDADAAVYDAKRAGGRRCTVHAAR